MSVSFSNTPSRSSTGQTTTSSGRYKNNYQQSPPPNTSQSGTGSGNSGSSGRGHKERGVSLMPNDIKIPKPPKQPDKPLPAYMRYSRKVWEKVKNQHPEMKMWDIGKLIGEQWRNLPEDERQGFNAEYEVEKSEYQEAMKVYHNSQAYRDWLKAKEKAQQAIQEQQLSEKLMGGSMPKEEPRFQLQQIEDDDDEGDFSVKHIAAARYQRNHRLITEILGDTVVPDIKTIVTRPRHENLKRQVQSLMQHQRKLESEIQDMEVKFCAKKQKIVEASRAFEEKVKTYLDPIHPLAFEEDNSDEEEIPEALPEATHCPLIGKKVEKESPKLTNENDSDPVPVENGTASPEVEKDKSTDTVVNKPNEDNEKDQSNDNDMETN